MLRIVVFIGLLFVFSCSKQSGYEKFHSNGKLAIKGHLIDGKKVGIWTEYDTLGNIKILQEYQNDTLI